MIIVKKGEELPSLEARSGVSAKGEYFCLEKKAEKGYDKITIWATNPGDLAGATAVAIEDIASISYYHKKDEKSGKWYDVVSMNAKLKATKFASSKPPQEFIDLVPEDEIKDIFNLDF